MNKYTTPQSVPFCSLVSGLCRSRCRLWIIPRVVALRASRVSKAKRALAVRCMISCASFRLRVEAFGFYLLWEDCRFEILAWFGLGLTHRWLSWRGGPRRTRHPFSPTRYGSMAPSLPPAPAHHTTSALDQQQRAQDPVPILDHCGLQLPIGPESMAPPVVSHFFHQLCRIAQHWPPASTPSPNHAWTNGSQQCLGNSNRPTNATLRIALASGDPTAVRSCHPCLSRRLGLPF
jgi:hypothetical protein